MPFVQPSEWPASFSDLAFLENVVFLRINCHYASRRCMFFFFSSRRRHTRFKCDWSSDVCSSDLAFSLPGTENAGVWKHRKKDGTSIDVEITSRPLVYDGRDARLVVATDVSVRKQAEEALVRAKEEAERTSKFKDQFLSTMSHELRTPLNAVLGFSDLLADERYGPLNEKQRRYIDHIHTGGKHLLALISDILDLSKIEAGRMELAIENLAVQAAFAEVLSVMQPLADKKSPLLSPTAEVALPA